MSKIEVNTVEPQCGTTLTLGANNDTVVLGTGAAFSGGIGAVKWETTPQTGSFAAAAGRGYFMNTTSGALTVTLPSGSAGAIVSLADYAGTWQTNNLTVSPQSGEKIGGVSVDVALNTEGQSVTFVYVDSTQGWINVQDSTSNVRGASYIVATGGTITCCGDYKIHTFTGPGTFTVCSVGNPAGSNTVDYLVVAGGGGGGGANGGGGGGGAGGYRESSGAASGCYTASPLGACVSALPVTATAFPITVGGGGSGFPSNANGSNSVFSTITSAGGGKAGCQTTGSNGGSGGGGSGNGCNAGGSGNTPPVSPPQGKDGGTSAPNTGGGGGGAGVAGADAAPCSPTGAVGGNGVATSISTSSVTRAGGGGGNAESGTGGAGGSGGGGKGGDGPTGNGVSGTANTGGGGGGVDSLPGAAAGGAGGSGIVIIRYKYQ